MAKTRPRWRRPRADERRQPDQHWPAEAGLPDIQQAHGHNQDVADAEQSRAFHGQGLGRKRGQGRANAASHEQRAHEARCQRRQRPRPERAETLRKKVKAQPSQRSTMQTVNQLPRLAAQRPIHPAAAGSLLPPDQWKINMCLGLIRAHVIPVEQRARQAVQIGRHAGIRSVVNGG
jgi:hypothetical protein